MMGLAPGTTTTFSGATAMPRERETWSAIAARNSGMPADGE